MQNQDENLKEEISADEPAITRKIIELSLDIQPNSPPVPRNQHPKSHGCVRAEFIVGEVPENLRFGIFKEPKIYPAWIRFSNGRGNDDKGEPLPDSNPDVRGMAIKLMDVDGEKILEGEEHERTQDFILINSPAFFLRNAKSSLDFSKAVKQAKGKPKILKLGIVLLKFGLFHRDEFKILKSTREQPISNPLTTAYWSATPYKLGSNAIKFSVTPHNNGDTDKSASNSKDGISRDYLREAMKKHLRNNEANFEFKVQLQANSNTMPIEDPTIQWSENESSYIKVATIRIPSQEFDCPTRKDFDEILSFNPWHSLHDHRPIGGINRLRKEVYINLSKQRHDVNKKPRKEPTPDEMANCS
jgi:hypothetical protein